jgi:hypothetical protein
MMAKKKSGKVRDLILSASAISALKFCAYSFYYKYILGIRPEAESDVLRIGSAWHEGLDILATSPESPCKFCSHKAKPDKDCYLCDGEGFVADIDDALNRMLDERYQPNTPLAAEKKMLERAKVRFALAAYDSVWSEQDDYDILFKELPFRIPLIDPRTRRPMPGVCIDGMIDKVVRMRDGTIAVMEHKSTDSDLSDESDYWNHLKLDTQISMYVYALQRLQVDGVLEKFGIRSDDPPIMDVVYDVWRKPKIRPKKLSASDTAKFIKTGEYFGVHFDHDLKDRYTEKDLADGCTFSVDGESVTVEFNKPKKDQEVGDPCVVESSDMFGVRTYELLTSEPDKYFRRKELSRLPVFLEKFELELFSLYQTISLMTAYDSWYHNEFSCEARRKCEYCPICYVGQEIDPEHPPVGFVNIFQNRTSRS